jgi:hypothetical protein
MGTGSKGKGTIQLGQQTVLTGRRKLSTLSVGVREVKIPESFAIWVEVWSYKQSQTTEIVSSTCTRVQTRVSSAQLRTTFPLPVFVTNFCFSHPGDNMSFGLWDVVELLKQSFSKMTLCRWIESLTLVRPESKVLHQTHRHRTTHPEESLCYGAPKPESSCGWDLATPQPNRARSKEIHTYTNLTRLDHLTYHDTRTCSTSSLVLLCIKLPGGENPSQFPWQGGGCTTVTQV